MGRRILVPFDESDQSTQALTWALEEFPDADVTVFHVIDASDVAYRGMEHNTSNDFAEVRTDMEEEAEQLFDDARSVAEDHGRDVTTATGMGEEVASEIIEHAEEHDIGHIVVGTHGRTGASRVLLGSVAEKVARRATIPVTIV